MTDPMPPLREPVARARELDVYLDLLSDALRARGARTRVVREVVGEVRAHCLATGASPLDAFGPAETYASARYRPFTVRWMLVSLASAVATAVGVVAVVRGGMATSPLAGPVAVTRDDVAFAAALTVASFLVPWLVYAVDRVVIARRLAAGRTGTGWPKGVVTLLVFLVLLALLVALPLDSSGVAVVHLPRWVLLGGGAVLFLAGLAPTPGQRPVPGPVVPARRRGAPRQRLLDWLLGRAP